jgi:hypothetical protein
VQFANESLRVDSNLLDYARAAKKTTFGSELEVIRAEGRYLLSRYQREASFANAEAAWGRLYNSVGLDVFPTAIDSYDIKTLAGEIQRVTTEMENSQLLRSTTGGGAGASLAKP